MSKIIIALVALVGISSASASEKPLFLPNADLVAAFSEVSDWVPGDKADYNLSIGFFKGTMKMEVLAINGAILDIRQLIEVIGQKQDCTVSLDVTTGEIKKIVCNGQDQNPEKPDLEIVDMRHEKVTVPAGTFDSTYIKAKDTAKGDITEQWANPQEIPVLGMIKTLADSQLGKMEVVLTSFQKK